MEKEFAEIFLKQLEEIEKKLNKIQEKSKKVKKTK